MHLYFKVPQIDTHLLLSVTDNRNRTQPSLHQSGGGVLDLLSLDIGILTLRSVVLNSIPTHVQNWIIVDVDSLLTDWQFKFYSKYKDGLPS